MGEEPAPGVELWMATSNVGGQAAAIARDAEAQGFDGVTFGDTQCQNPDAFVGLTVAAAATTHLGLGVGVTNPVTRHPAALAAAMASIQHVSHGRAVLGIGRGDSAVTKIGLPAASAAELEGFLGRLQAYLSGHLVEEDGPLARLTWLEALSIPKVPVDVVGSGPGVIAAGARLAERVTFNVGADPGRVAACIDLVRQERQAAGLDPGGASLGAYVGVAPHPDREVARALVKPVTAVYARFSRTRRPSASRLDPRGMFDRRDMTIIEAVSEHYDMSRHGGGDASHLALLTDDFVDRFAVAGDPQDCVDRLAQLAALGLDRLAIVGPSPHADPGVVEESRALLSTVVLPGLRSRRPPPPARPQPA